MHTNFDRKYPKNNTNWKIRTHTKREKKQYAIEKWSKIKWTGLIWLRMLVIDGI